MSRTPYRPRIALVSVRFTLFDPQMGPGFPERMRAHAERSAALLDADFDVLRTPLAPMLAAQTCI